MRGIAGERTLMRIYIDETDRVDGDLLYKRILHILHDRGMAGTTIIQTMMSFGSRRIVHSELNETTSLDRPVVVECIDDESRLLDVLPRIDPLIRSGLITFERAQVVVYRGAGKADAPDDRAGPEAR